MKNILQTWIYGFSVMLIAAICIFIASLPLRVPAMIFFRFHKDYDSTTLPFFLTYNALYIFLVPILFGWLIDRVLKYSTPRIRHALGKSAFIGEKQ